MCHCKGVRSRLQRGSQYMAGLGAVTAVGGFVTFELSVQRHQELRGMAVFLFGLAALIIGVMVIAMCKVARAAIAPRLAAALLSEEYPDPPGQPQLRLCDPPASRSANI